MCVLLHGGWRMLVAFAIVVAPLYGWILLYYLSTGAWQQSTDVVRMNAPLLATFFIPLIIGAWVIGFRGWYIVIGAVVAAIITGWLPVFSIANQLIPNGYANLAVVLILLMICLRAFQYWRDYIIGKLPIARYTRGAYIVAILAVTGLLVLLLPVQI